LLDDRDNIIDGFEPLTTFSNQKCCWNNNSNIFVIAVSRFTYGYLLAKVPDLEISFIKMLNPYPLDIYFKKDALVISYNNHQLELLNSTETFGGGHVEIPVKRYLNPKEIELQIENLTFYPRQNLPDLLSLTKSEKEYCLEPIDGGFREFKGVLPQSTMQVYNQRQLEVYQLEAFAEFGDEQSKEWLNAIKKKTNENYNKWQKVTDYIGFQKRGTISKS
jgi:hypothetical protein